MTCGTLYIFFMRFFLKKIVLFLKIPMETSGLGFQGHPQLCISEFTWPHRNSPSGSFFLCTFGRVHHTTKCPKREEMSQLVVCRVVGAHPFHQNLAWLSGGTELWIKPTLLHNSFWWQHQVERVIYSQRVSQPILPVLCIALAMLPAGLPSPLPFGL